MKCQLLAIYILLATLKPTPSPYVFVMDGDMLRAHAWQIRMGNGYPPCACARSPLFISIIIRASARPQILCGYWSAIFMRMTSWVWRI